MTNRTNSKERGSDKAARTTHFLEEERLPESEDFKSGVPFGRAARVEGRV